MFMIDPPAVPADVPTTSTNPVIAAVEWACQLAGLECEVPDRAVFGHADGNNRIEMVTIRLPELGIYLDVENRSNAVVRERNKVGRLVFTGEQGHRDLVAYLGRLKAVTEAA